MGRKIAKITKNLTKNLSIVVYRVISVYVFLPSNAKRVQYQSFVYIDAFQIRWRVDYPVFDPLLWCSAFHTITATTSFGIVPSKVTAQPISGIVKIIGPCTNPPEAFFFNGPVHSFYLTV